MEEPSPSALNLSKCKKTVQFKTGDYTYISEKSLKSKQKRFGFFSKLFRKSKPREMLAVKKSYIPLNVEIPSDYSLRDFSNKRPMALSMLPQDFHKAMLYSGLRPLGDTITFGREKSKTELPVLARETPLSSPASSPTVSFQSLPKFEEEPPPPPREKSRESLVPVIEKSQETIAPIQETVEEEKSNLGLPVVEPPPPPRLLEKASDDSLSSTSTTSSDEMEQTINIHVKNRLEELQQRKYIIDTRMFLDTSSVEGEMGSETPTLMNITYQPEIPTSSDEETTFKSSPTTSASSLGPEIQHDPSSGDNTFSNILSQPSKINMELIIMEDNEDGVCAGDFDMEKPLVNVGPCVGSLNERKSRSKMVMVGPVLCDKYEPLLPTIASEVFMKEETSSSTSSSSGEEITTTVLIMCTHSDEKPKNYCCLSKFEYGDCGCSDSEISTIEVSSYCDNDGLEKLEEIQETDTVTNSLSGTTENVESTSDFQTDITESTSKIDIESNNTTNTSKKTKDNSIISDLGTSITDKTIATNTVSQNMISSAASTVDLNRKLLNTESTIEIASNNEDFLSSIIKNKEQNYSTQEEVVYTTEKSDQIDDTQEIITSTSNFDENTTEKSEYIENFRDKLPFEESTMDKISDTDSQSEYPQSTDDFTVTSNEKLLNSTSTTDYPASSTEKIEQFDNNQGTNKFKSKEIYCGPILRPINEKVLPNKNSCGDFCGFYSTVNECETITSGTTTTILQNDNIVKIIIHQTKPKHVFDTCGLYANFVSNFEEDDLSVDDVVMVGPIVSAVNPST